MNLPLTRAGSAGAGVAYLFNEQFTTDDAAPLASPRTCEPGPGGSQSYENDGTLSISGGKLLWTPQASWAHGDLTWWMEETFARTLGRQFIWDVERTTGTENIYNWITPTAITIPGTPGTPVGAFVLQYSNNLSVGNGTSTVVLTHLPETIVNERLYVAVVLRAAGVHYLMKGGGLYTDWTLVHTHDNGTNGPLRFAAQNLTSTFNFDAIQVPDALWYPTPLCHDTFARGDSSDLGSTNGLWHDEEQQSALAWIEQSGNWEISGNKLKAVGPSPSDPDWIAVVETGIDEVNVEMYPTSTIENLWGCVVRWAADDSHGFALTADKGVGLDILEWDGAAYTSRATNGTNPYGKGCICFAAGERIQIRPDWGNSFQSQYTNAAVDNGETRHGVILNTEDDTIQKFAVWPRDQSGNVPSYYP